MNVKPQIIYKKLEQNFEKRGYINLEQKEVNSKDDIVEISNIFNSKRYESFRVVYLKDNKIQGYETITSHLPTKVHMSDSLKGQNNMQRFYYKVNNRMQRLNANNYYLIHNHPSGVSYVSNDDIYLTAQFMRNVKGFKGHIVLGDDEYSWLYKDKKIPNRLNVEEQIPINQKDVNKVSEKIDKFYENLSQLNPNLTPSKLNFFENYDLSSTTALVNLLKCIETRKDFTPVFLTNSRNKINLIIDVPNKMFNMTQSQLRGYFKNLAVLNGASRVLVATSDKDTFKSCMKHCRYGTFSELLYYKNLDNKRIEYVEAPRELLKVDDVFQKPKIKMNFGSVVLENNKPYIKDKNTIPIEEEKDYIEIPAYDTKSTEQIEYEERLNNDEDDFTEPKEGQVRILLKRVGKDPVIKVINNTLEEKQKLVDGLIEVIEYDDKNLIIANEESKVLNMKPNLAFDLDYIAGDCFFIGDDFENEGFKSLDLRSCNEIIRDIKNKAFIYKDTEFPSKDVFEKER